MLAIFLAPVYLALIAYLGFWLLRWAGACHQVFGTRIMRVLLSTVFLLLSLTPLLGFLIRSPAGLHRVLLRIGYSWFGWLLYLTMAVVAVELVVFAVRRVRGKDFEQMQQVRRVQGGIALALLCAVCLYGQANAHTLRVTEYDVTVDKPGQDLTIALMADFHLGYSTNPSYIERAVRAVNDMQPDLIVIAGDIFDNEYEAVPQPDRIAAALASMQSTFGTFACWGNHDLSEPILAGFTWDDEDENKNDPRMAEFLEKAGVTLLDDQTLTLENGVQLAGRRDPSRSRKLGEQRQDAKQLLAGLDSSRAVVVIDHQPGQLAELAQAGADLVLSGHTHDGQLFPGNLLLRLLSENSCGVVQKEGLTSVVTSGLGTWGPSMRVGTNSEVVRIDVHFTENSSK